MSPGRGLPIRLPMIGLICVMTYFCLFVTALPLLVAQWERQPMGFRIHLLAHTGEGVNFDPRTEVPVVRIDAHDHVYLNAREVKWAELPEALKAALRQRVDQWVYFEGDPDINFAKAAQAIDIIESEGGKAVLLTPRTKVEAK